MKIIAMKLATWALLAIALLLNLAYLVNPGSGKYSLLALVPIIAAIILLVPILSANLRRKHE